MSTQPLRTGPETLAAFQAKWAAILRAERLAEEEAELDRRHAESIANGTPFDEFEDVQEWRPNQITLGLGTGSYGGPHD